MTEHRCTDGTWKPDKAKHCPICHPPKPPSITITGDLPGRSSAVSN